MSNKINPKMILAISKAYEHGDTAVISRLEAIALPSEEKLPPELQECLESWGKTPIEEPEFFKLATSGTLEDVKAAAVKDLNIDDYNAVDIGTLASRVSNQIQGKIDADGKYKTTPNIDQVKLPRTTQLRALKKLATVATDVADEVGITGDTVEEKMTTEIFKIAGVKQEDLTDWEEDLIKNMFYSYIQAVDNDTLGSYSDRTPFARYIKN